MVVDIYQDMKRQGIHLALFTDPEGDSCFSIYQISWIEMKKKCLLYIKNEHVGHFVKCIFTLLLQIQHHDDNNFLSTSKQRQEQ